MAETKFKKLEHAVEKESHATVLAFGLERVTQLYKILTVLYHRNKNQHNMKLYFKHIKRLRITLLRIITAATANTSSSLQLYGLIRYGSNFGNAVIKKMIYDFYNVINGKTFINLAIVMLTVIAELYDILIVGYVDKIDCYLRDNKNLEIVRLKKGLRVVPIREKKQAHELDVELESLLSKHRDGDILTADGDLGEEIEMIEELDVEVVEKTEHIVQVENREHRTEPQDLPTPVAASAEKPQKKTKKAKKKKGKSLIDDIFGGF